MPLKMRTARNVLGPPARRGEHPFTHALDVIDAKTVCINLDMIHAHQTFGAKFAMSEDGSEVELRGQARGAPSPCRGGVLVAVAAAIEFRRLRARG